MIKFSDILLESSEKIKCNHCGWSWKKSEGGKDLHVCHKCGHDCKPGSFDEFAQTRMKGADKIATTAKEKGGLAMLTYHHFNVKKPYYKKAAEGKFNLADAEKEWHGERDEERLLGDSLMKDARVALPVGKKQRGSQDRQSSDDDGEYLCKSDGATCRRPLLDNSKADY